MVENEIEHLTFCQILLNRVDDYAKVLHNCQFNTDFVLMNVSKGILKLISSYEIQFFLEPKLRSN